MTTDSLPRCYVAYLDILGYKERVRDAVEKHVEAEEISKIGDAINEVRNACEEWVFDSSIQVFSDCVLLSVPESENSCFGILYLAAHAIGRLAYRDFWVRGAVVRGFHYDQDGILFSPALIAAHRMEREDAFHPRVLVHPEVVRQCQEQALEEAERQMVGCIWPDNDGRGFLSYLGVTTCGCLGNEQAVVLLKAHGEHIARRLQDHEGSPPLVAKYEWLRHYHNRFCRQGLRPGEGDRYIIYSGVQ